MVIRVLIINRQLVFAVTIKQALEQTGAFEVHPFTDPNAAMEYLRTHPHDVALVDFSNKIMPGKNIVAGLREIHPEIAIIASPMQADSNRVIRDLQLQGMIDAPFSARGIIPLIEHAVEQMSQPTEAITRTFVEPDKPTVADTEVLSRQGPVDVPPPVRGGPMDTNALPDEDWTRFVEHEPENAPQTRILHDEPDEPVHTRILDDEEENAPQTRILQDEPDEPVHTRILDDGEDNPPQTRILQDEPDEPVQTRILDDVDDSDAPWLPDGPARTRILDEDPDAPIETRNLGEGAPSRPPRLPEFSSLDDVLADEAPSTLFEPPLRDGDTPSVPSVDSDAVRQFLATTRDTGEFDRMLGDISYEDEGDAPPQLPGGDFEDLVNSMRAEQQYTPLPDRHQQFVEFILTGGMDTLLSEIEQRKTGTLEEEEKAPPAAPEKPKSQPRLRMPSKQTPPETFEKLAAEEPPMPTLEEGGTVSDLMVGVSDSSFRNVLEMMRGEEPQAESPVEEQEPPSHAELDEAFSIFTEQAAKAAELDEEVEPTVPLEFEPPAELPPALEDDDDLSTTARLILETALDESAPVDSFSISNLIDNIERQLAEHKPDIQPLPSWNVPALHPKQQVAPPADQRAPSDEDRYIKEPDFLPEEFSEELTALPTDEEPLEESPEELWRQAEQVKAAIRSTQELAAAQVEEAEEESEPELAEEARTAIDPQWLFDTEDEEPAPEAHEEWAEEAPDEPEEQAALAEEEEWSPEMLAQPEEEPAGEAEAWPEMDMAEIAAHFEESVQPEPDYEYDAPAELPDEGFDEATVVGEHAVLPADLWDDLSEDWDSDTDWDSAPVAEEEIEEQEAVPDLEDDWEVTIDEGLEDETVMMERPYRDEEPVALGAAADFEPEVTELEATGVDDPYIAHIALSLTQVSLELAAEATLLTTEDEIVAIAGTLPPADVDSLRAILADDWDANPNEARVRFVNLPGSNKDYMLYSRKTVNDFTLTMIFSGSTPLRDIRRQGRRLIEALENVPEVAPEMPEESVPNLAMMTGEVPAVELAPAEPDVVQPFTYLWLLRDPESAFADQTSRAIVAGLHLQLGELGWQLKSLRAQGEYVYVHADIPGERPAYQVVDDLKRRVAEIVHAQEPSVRADSLWADSYLVMMPGRELDPDEINQFIAFERMA